MAVCLEYETRVFFRDEAVPAICERGGWARAVDILSRALSRRRITRWVVDRGNGRAVSWIARKSTAPEAKQMRGGRSCRSAWGWPLSASPEWTQNLHPFSSLAPCAGSNRPPRTPHKQTALSRRKVCGQRAMVVGIASRTTGKDRDQSPGLSALAVTLCIVTRRSSRLRSSASEIRKTAAQYEQSKNSKVPRATQARSSGARRCWQCAAIKVLRFPGGQRLGNARGKRGPPHRRRRVVPNPSRSQK